EAVTDGSGRGSGGAGADFQQPAYIDVRDRPAAGTDRVDIESRRLQWIAVHVHLARELRLEVLDEGDVGRRSAHVEGDQMTKASQASDLETPHHAGRRAREHRAHGLGARGVER